MKKEDKTPNEKPKKIEKNKPELPDLVIKYAHRTKQGVLASNPAKTNQDSFVALEIDNGTHLFAVADGHGTHGHIVSQMASRRLVEFFSDNSSRAKPH